MSRADRLPLTALVLVVSGPLAWLACGGESKPAESPAAENASPASSEEATASKTAAPVASGSSAPEEEKASAPAASAAPAAAAAPAPPPTPSLGSTDCGKCIDKTCAKPAAACGKNGDCQSMMDGMHSCSSGAASCIEGATMPSDAKPKKLAAAYEGCAKKAVAKTCKAKCK